MVKKCIFALAVVALLATLAPAETVGSPEFDNQPDGSIKRDGDWPWTYKEIPICKFPVYMEVGHFVQIFECHERKIELVQVDCESLDGRESGDFPCYSDCETIKVRANFPAVFGATLDKGSTGILTDTRLYWAGDDNQINGSVDWEELTICLEAWKAEIWKATTASTKIQVGEITINVKPPDTGS